MLRRRAESAQPEHRRLPGILEILGMRCYGHRVGVCECTGHVCTRERRNGDLRSPSCERRCFKSWRAVVRDVGGLPRRVRRRRSQECLDYSRPSDYLSATARRHEPEPAVVAYDALNATASSASKPESQEAWAKQPRACASRGGQAAKTANPDKPAKPAKPRANPAPGQPSQPARHHPSCIRPPARGRPCAAPLVPAASQPPSWSASKPPWQPVRRQRGSSGSPYLVPGRYLAGFFRS